MGKRKRRRSRPVADEIEAIDAAEVAALEQAADMPSHAEAAAADLERKRAQDARERHEYRSSNSVLCDTCGLGAAAKVHVEGRGAVAQSVERDSEKVEAAGSIPARPAEPKGALESLVETLVEQAVGARLDALARELQATRRYALHTMHLVVVLADRFNVTPEQLAGAYAATQQAEAARKEQV